MSGEDGFDKFYRDNHRRVVISLRLATGSTELAEELAQEAFARTLARWSRVRGGGNPAGYVYRVAFRLHRRSVFRRDRQRDAALAAHHRATRSRSSPSELWGEVVAVQAAFAQLPLGCRRAAALCLYAELTAEEAATVLGLSASTVRTQLQRARQSLSAAVGTDTDDEEPPATSDSFGAAAVADRRDDGQVRAALRGGRPGRGGQGTYEQEGTA